MSPFLAVSTPSSAREPVQALLSRDMSRETLHWMQNWWKFRIRYQNMSHYFNQPSLVNLQLLHLAIPFVNLFVLLPHLPPPSLLLLLLVQLDALDALPMYLDPVLDQLVPHPERSAARFAPMILLAGVGHHVVAQCNRTAHLLRAVRALQVFPGGFVELAVVPIEVLLGAEGFSANRAEKAVLEVDRVFVVLEVLLWRKKELVSVIRDLRC